MATSDYIEAKSTLLPSGIESAKSPIRFSNNLARQSVVALDAACAIAWSMTLPLSWMPRSSRAPKNPSLTGCATPLGLVNQPGTLSMPGIGPLSLDDLHDAIGTALGANVDPARLR